MPDGFRMGTRELERAIADVRAVREHLKRGGTGIDIKTKATRVGAKKAGAGAYTKKFSNKALGARSAEDRAKAKAIREAKDLERTAGKNATIWRVQAKAGRNPMFVDDRERKAIARMLLSVFRDEFKSMVRQRKLRLKSYKGVFGEIGKYAVAAIRRHVYQGRGKDGPLKPNTARTRKMKIRRWGEDKPLIRTGQLLRSIAWEVIRGR